MNTVDDSTRNPANSPVVVGSLSHDLEGFGIPRWLFWISEPSRVCEYIYIHMFHNIYDGYVASLVKGW